MNLRKLTFAFLLFPLFSLAQSNFKPGYVVSLNGDTTKGFIDYKEWARNPQKINFKNSPEASQLTIFTAKDAAAFGVTGFEYYNSYTLSISLDKVNNASLTRIPDTTQVTRTVFLRVLNKGQNVTLYIYADDVKDRFFISEAGARPTELVYHRFLDPDQPSNVITRDTYKRQLQRLAYQYQQGNSALLAQIQSTPYAEADLFKIVTKINGGVAPENASSNRKNTRFFGGLALNNSTINSTVPAGTSVSKSSSPFFPKADIGVDFLTNKNVGKIIFRFDLSFTGSKNQFTYSGEASNGIAGFKEVLSFNQYVTALDPQLIYNIYNSAALKFYVAVGANISYCTYTNKKDMYTDEFDNSPAISQDFPSLPNILFNVSTKAGISINNRFEIYAGYNLPTNMTGNYAYELKLTGYQLGFNYFFGRGN